MILTLSNDHRLEYLPSQIHTCNGVAVQQITLFSSNLFVLFPPPALIFPQVSKYTNDSTSCLIFLFSFIILPRANHLEPLSPDSLLE
ncbi:unnamed protein product [Fusarium graminearum]|nr:unnamed protein product [Fusarium graminearum]